MSSGRLAHWACDYFLCFKYYYLHNDGIRLLFQSYQGLVVFSIFVLDYWRLVKLYTINDISLSVYEYVYVCDSNRRHVQILALAVDIDRVSGEFGDEVRSN